MKLLLPIIFASAAWAALLPRHDKGGDEAVNNDGHHGSGKDVHLGDHGGHHEGKHGGKHDGDHKGNQNDKSGTYNAPYVTVSKPMTVSTIYASQVTVISTCPGTVSPCPYHTSPVTTVIVATSTTVCPIDETTTTDEPPASNLYADVYITVVPAGSASTTPRPTPVVGDQSAATAGAPGIRRGGSMAVAIAVGVAALL